MGVRAVYTALEPHHWPDTAIDAQWLGGCADGDGSRPRQLALGRRCVPVLVAMFGLDAVLRHVPRLTRVSPDPLFYAFYRPGALANLEELLPAEFATREQPWSELAWPATPELALLVGAEPAQLRGDHAVLPASEVPKSARALASHSEGDLRAAFAQAEAALASQWPQTRGSFEVVRPLEVHRLLRSFTENASGSGAAIAIHWE